MTREYFAAMYLSMLHMYLINSIYIYSSLDRVGLYIDVA
jgi:hypothetical protein